MTNRIALAAAVFLGVFFFVVWVKTQVVRSGYQATELKARLSKLDLELAEAEIKLMAIKSPRIAAERAKERGYRLAGDYPLDAVRHIK
ncbi:MAG: hypothetical protein HY401_08175 [Elusimicrobia bacterium]|nr:hypothetical protein [Elusimicrobiota bacterium]